MAMLRSLFRGLMAKESGAGLPPLPAPRHEYVLVTGDMVAFDLLDGTEECGGVELRPDSEGDPAPWMVHVYGVDLTFPTLGKARAWLGKPAIRME